MQRMSLQAIQLVTALILGGVPYLVWLAGGQGFALKLSNRAVSLSTATPSAVAAHSFQLTTGTTAAVGSMVFEYCANSPLFESSCDPPAGLSLTGAALTQQTGNTGFSIDTIDSTASRLVISRPPVAAAAVPSSYTFSNVVNPSANDQTTYVRISTYNSTQGAGSFIDEGSVAFSTVPNFAVGAYVPPFLNLCVGITVAGDCSQATGDSLDLGVLSAQATRSATSQFAASTNDYNGCIIYVLGTTMTSGNNIIPAVVNQPAGPSNASKFGLNLRKNNNPAVGEEPSGAGTIIPASSYNSPNFFSFIAGSQIANSPLSTDYKRLTVSYAVNVNASQPPGVYTTTLTYLGSAQF
jgi:hypothetical protein